MFIIDWEIFYFICGHSNSKVASSYTKIVENFADYFYKTYARGKGPK